MTLARETTKNKRMLKELEENLLTKLTSIEVKICLLAKSVIERIE